MTALDLDAIALALRIEADNHRGAAAHAGSRTEAAYHVDRFDRLHDLADQIHDTLAPTR